MKGGILSVSQHTPHVVAPPVEAIEDHQGGNGDGENGSDGEVESNFEGCGSDDSEETVPCPDPEETVPHPLEDTESDGGEFAETVQECNNGLEQDVTEKNE